MWIVNITGLALLDSLSFASIVLTIYLLLSKTDFSPSRVFIYLLTVASFYFVLGIGLIYGLESVFHLLISKWKEHTFAQSIQFVLGLLLVIMSFWLDSRPKRTDKFTHLKPQNTYKSMIMLGVTVSVIEAATMFPFLTAIGIITSKELEVFQWMPILFFYCVVMIAPPLILLLLKVAFGRKANPLLNAVNRKIEPYANEALSWVTGIVGLWLAADGISRFIL